MKKNRPGTLLTVDRAARRARERLSAVDLPRDHDARRPLPRDRSARCLDRDTVIVQTPAGPIRIKVARRDGAVLNAAPEFDDCVRAAAASGRPVKEVQALAVRAFFDQVPGGLTVSRYYLTTAIDYVNSRPHLGTAYEKITADVIARYKRLCGFDVHFLMGNDEHSQNVYKRAVEQGLPQQPGRLLRPDGRGVPQRLGRARLLVRRLHPHHAAAAPRRGAEDGAGVLRRRRHLRGRLRRLVLRLVRGVQAGEGSRRRQVSAAPDAHAGVDPREELLLPALQVPRPAAEALRGASGVPGAGDPPQRDPAAARRRPRGHLDEPGRAVVGHAAAVRCPTASSTSGSTR